MPTIKDVAKLAGVSVSTVSRAMSDSSLVTRETKERIQQAVDELQYVPDHSARSLKKGRSKTIALVVPTILNPFFPRLVSCFSAEINRYGYANLLYVTNYSRKEERACFESAKAFSTDGILYVPGTDDVRHIRQLLDFRLPTVIINRNPGVAAPCVTNNDFGGAYCAVEHLIKNGHRRVCCFVGDRSLQNMRERYEGCQKAFADYGIADSEVVYTDSGTANDIYHFVRQLLSSEGITAFYASSDWMTTSIYSGVQSVGREIPRDISVAGFDDNADSQYMFPPLTTWHHPIEEIARRSVGLLVDSLETGRDITDSEIIVTGEMILRGSTGSIGPAPRKIEG